MNEIKSVCVYCGSSGQVDERYREFSAELGAALAARSITMIYGGGRVGLMGLAADACLGGGGKVVGIIPDFLERFEVGHAGLTELIVVDSMHVRKQRMAELADAFVVLPGGFGTLDEFFEILTWRQLGLHSKPIILVDVAGYWQPLIALLDHMMEKRFAKAEMGTLWAVVDGLEGLFAALAVAPPEIAAPQTKWA